MQVLVIGDNGQDGQIISGKLHSLGMKVVGASRSRILVNGQFRDPVNFVSPKESAAFLTEYEPEMIFHVAAIHGSSSKQESVITKQRQEMYECHVDISRNILEWMASRSPSTKLHVALSSQMYTAKDVETYVDEETDISPINFYGKTKADAWDLVKHFRNEFGLQANASILFNHTSKFSKRAFVFSFLAEQFALVLKGESRTISVRDPSGSFDVSSAFEICDAMVDSVRKAPAEDFVLGSGKLTILYDVIENTIKTFGLPESCFIWESRIQNSGLSSRPALMANPQKAREILGWRSSASPEDILEAMILNQLNRGAD